MRAVILLLLCGVLRGQPFNVPNVNDLECPYAETLADVIYRAEGAERARVPYGVLSVPVAGEAHARAVTIESIHANWVRWTEVGRPGKTPEAFVDFMSRRWVPVKSDPIGHRNWRRNVALMLRAELKKTREIAK